MSSDASEDQIKKLPFVFFQERQNIIYLAEWSQ